MKAVRFFEYGGPEMLRVVDVDTPQAGPGTVRIAVRAAGVNGIDWKLRSGEMRELMPLELPSGTGLDASGIVDQIGAGVETVEVGDRVFGTGSATLAEYAVLTHWVTMPDGLSFAEAAGYGVSVETAIRILNRVEMQPGQTLLVSGASGGVGSAVVQFARARKIEVIGTASVANHGYLKRIGAVPTVYGPGLVQRVRNLAPGGVHAALDISGAGVIPDLITITGNPSKVVSIADFSAPQYGAEVSVEPQNRTEAFDEAARMFVAGSFTLPVADRYPLVDAASAHRASATGHVAGRRIVTVSD